MTTWVLVLAPVSEMLIGLMDWKSWKVTVTPLGMYSALRLEERFAGKRIRLPPVATPPVTTRVPPILPASCSPLMKLTLVALFRSRLLIWGAAELELMLTPPSRVMAPTGREPVLKMTVPPVAVIVLFGALALMLLLPKNT